MKKHFTARYMAHASLTAALYVAITAVSAPLAFRDVQFRFAEVLNLMAFFHPIYAVGVTLGCLLSNMLFSEFVPWDVIIGTSCTAMATFLITKTKNIFLASLIPVIFTLPVAAMLAYLLELPFWLTALTVAFGEFTVVVVIGYPLFKFVLLENKLYSRLFLHKGG